MKINKPIGIAAVGVIGIPVAYLALGALGILVKFPFPQKANIQLTISAADLQITGSSGNRGNCTTSNHIGCVHVPRNKTAKITYRLVGLPDWKFSRMQLVAEPSDKLDFGSQTGFTTEMQDDFYVRINGVKVYPDSNGIIDLGDLADGRKFVLVDRNRFPPEGSLLPQIYKYQIEACDGDCKATDPKIENEGDN